MVCSAILGSLRSGSQLVFIFHREELVLQVAQGHAGCVVLFALSVFYHCYSDFVSRLGGQCLRTDTVSRVVLPLGLVKNLNGMSSGTEILSIGVLDNGDACEKNGALGPGKAAQSAQYAVKTT